MGGNNNNNNNNNRVRSQQSQHQHQQQRSGQSLTNSRGEPLKFEGEFDFEQANARFEQEIEKEFTDKVKISTGGSSSSGNNKQSNNNNDTSSLSNSQSMNLQDEQHLLMKQKSLGQPGSGGLDGTPAADALTSLGGHNQAINDENKHFYDKNISFFDRISCEANEKAQGGKPKNWKEERKLNAETFGLQNKMAMAHHMNRSRNLNNNRAGYQNHNNMSNKSNQNRSINNNSNSRYNNNSNTNGLRMQSGGQQGNRLGSGYGNNNHNPLAQRNGSGNGSSGRRFGSR